MDPEPPPALAVDVDVDVQLSRPSGVHELGHLGEPLPR
jgi:hypothetical protein